MRAIFKTPMLEQVKRLIQQNRDAEPELSHIEMRQSEFTKLCADLRGKYGENNPRDTDAYIIVDGVHIRRVR